MNEFERKYEELTTKSEDIHYFEIRNRLKGENIIKFLSTFMQLFPAHTMLIKKSTIVNHLNSFTNIKKSKLASLTKEQKEKVREEIYKQIDHHTFKELEEYIYSTLFKYNVRKKQERLLQVFKSEKNNLIYVDETEARECFETHKRVVKLYLDNYFFKTYDIENTKEILSMLLTLYQYEFETFNHLFTFRTNSLLALANSHFDEVEELQDFLKGEFQKREITFDLSFASLDSLKEFSYLVSEIEIKDYLATIENKIFHDLETLKIKKDVNLSLYNIDFLHERYVEFQIVKKELGV